MAGPIENEVKIRVDNLSAIRSKLMALGFLEHQARTFEANTLFDTTDQSLRRGGTLLRLRQMGDKSIVTWKGKKEAGPHRSRPELETSLGSFEVGSQIFSNLGFVASFRYEKYRSEMKRANEDQAVVTLDETPIGLFIELEGPAQWVDATAKELGFSEKDYVLDSYGKLYFDYCKQHRLQPEHMVFPSSE